MHNFNLVYITLFFVFAIAFSAGPIGSFNLARLVVKFNGSSRLFVNREGKLFFKITNSNATSSSWAIEIYCDKNTSLIGTVRGGEIKSASIDITPNKRGEFECEESYIQSFFPLSTVRFLIPLEDSCKSIVYPEPKGISLRSFLNKQKSYYGEEKDFDGLSNYSGVESLSRIHWASVAKGDVLVKRFIHEEHTQELAFKFKEAGRDNEARLSQLCLWVLASEKISQPFTIDMPNRLLSSKKESIDEILTHLARY